MRQARSRRYSQPLVEPGPGALVDIYARYSSEMQDGVTLLTQVTRCTSVVEGRGWQVRRVWQEPETSAKYEVEDVEKRPQFAALLAAAERHECQAIICWKSDRWARNVGMSSTTLAQLRRWGIWWLTADGEFDSASIAKGAGKLTHTIKAALDENYVDTVSDHSAAGKLTRAQMGYHNNSIPPFGYLPPDYPPRPDGAPALWRPPKMPMRLDPAHAPVVLRIGEACAAGMSYSEIAMFLNRLGLRRRLYGTRRSQFFPDQDMIPWTKEGVFAVMRCSLYREFAPGTGRGTIITPDGTAVPGLHDAIWTYDLWQRIDEQKAARRGNAHSSLATRAHYPFAGIIICAGCGFPMRSMSTHGNRYHHCIARQHGGTCSEQRHMSNAATVEGTFGKLLLTYRLGDSWRADLHNLLGDTATTSYRESVALERTRLERQQRLLNTMLRAEGITEDDYLRDLASVKRELAALPQLDTQHETVVVHAGETLDALPEAWRDATIAERRVIVASLLRYVRWSHDAQTIIALTPLAEYLPSLALILMPHGWQQQGTELVRVTSGEAIQPAVPGGKLSLAQQVEISRRVQAGESMVNLAREFGVFHATIWRIINKPRRDLRRLLEEDPNR